MFFHNIMTVAKYESKILYRSWFFKVFSILVYAFIFWINIYDLIYWYWASTVNYVIGANWPLRSLIFLNIGQSVIAIFLASEFLKRDKKLDTSEVFYVRPLSNAEYVIGKVWRDLRVFFLLNIIILLMVLIMNVIGPANIDFAAYVFYFLMLSLPSLVYIIGLSIFLMLVINSQAVTFVVLLGYIGVSAFYLDDKVFFLFDYMGMSIPMMKSDITGYSRIMMMVNQRLMYLLLGTALTFFSITLFKRLPNSHRSVRPWLIAGVLIFAGAVYCGYKHIDGTLGLKDRRESYIGLNNRYVHFPKITPENYIINIEQLPNSIRASVEITGWTKKESDKFVFVLNPGMTINSVKSGGGELPFERIEHLLIVDLGETMPSGHRIDVIIEYEGRIDESICYLDIKDEEFFAKKSENIFSIDKRYAIQTPKYLLFTPETYWYPIPGTSYSTISQDWQEALFCNFEMNVKPLEGLLPVSSGNMEVSDERIYSFKPDFPMKSASVAIGNYNKISVEADSVEYSVLYIADRDNYFEGVFDSIFDTIPVLIKDQMEWMNRTWKLDYPFERLSIVEVPAHFTSYPRAWTQAQEAQQPEIVFFPEAGYEYWNGDFKKAIQNNLRWAKQNGREMTEKDATVNAFRSFLGRFSWAEFEGISMNNDKIWHVVTPNPLFLYAQYYNFSYNIYSRDWTFVNRLIESYLQIAANDNPWGNTWIREYLGLTSEEQVNHLIQKKSFIELLSDQEHVDLTKALISQNVSRLFAEAELEYGVEDFRDYLFEFIKERPFDNIIFEDLLDSITAVSGVEFDALISDWNRPLSLPSYYVGRPIITQIDRMGEESYQWEMVVSNFSDTEGIIRMNVESMRTQSGMAEDNPLRWNVRLGPHETKRIVKQWPESPRMMYVNTLMSQNIPSVTRYTSLNAKEPYKEAGEYRVFDNFLDVPGEIVVDNEDPLLFSISKGAPTGYLSKWLVQDKYEEFKYKGVPNWRAPVQWTLSANPNYSGYVVKSAYSIKKGSGSQYAQWKIPVPEEGQYELYYWLIKPQELMYGRNRANFRGSNRRSSDSEYLLLIDYDGQVDEAYLNANRADDGWILIGVYNFPADTVTVKITDKTKLSRINADAVKIVRR